MWCVRWTKEGSVFDGRVHQLLRGEIVARPPPRPAPQFQAVCRVLSGGILGANKDNYPQSRFSGPGGAAVAAVQSTASPEQSL